MGDEAWDEAYAHKEAIEKAEADRVKREAQGKENKQIKTCASYLDGLFDIY